MIAVKRAAHEPLRLRGLRPIQPGGKKRLSVRRKNGRRHRTDRTDFRKKPSLASCCRALNSERELALYATLASSWMYS